MRYSSNLQGTVWQRANAELVRVEGDPTFHFGNPKRKIKVRNLGSNFPSEITVTEFVRHHTPYDGRARMIFLSGDGYGRGIKNRRSGYGSGRMRCDLDFTGTLWENEDTGKVIQVTHDPRFNHSRKRKLTVITVRGDTEGHTHQTSPLTLHYET